eukprot:COSAG01_NODE_15012_length_1385_cov_1.896579_1_plen_333_part_00
MQGVGDGQEPPPTPAKILKVDGERRYGLGAVLGEGSYGVVREGLELRTLKVVAVKSLDRRLLKKQRRGLENLKREIRVHKLLGSHPTIVSLRETIDIEHKSKLHMVLDYMHCGSVQDVLDRAPNNALGQAQARQYFGGLLLSLEHIHSVGVVHKDVKPANMLLDRLGNVHLSDFGCAEELGRYDAQDTCRQTLGSPAFQSPVSGGECRVPSAFDVSHARCLPYASFLAGDCHGQGGIFWFTFTSAGGPGMSRAENLRCSRVQELARTAERRARQSSLPALPEAEFWKNSQSSNHLKKILGREPIPHRTVTKVGNSRSDHAQTSGLNAPTTGG